MAKNDPKHAKEANTMYGGEGARTRPSVCKLYAVAIEGERLEHFLNQS